MGTTGNGCGEPWRRSVNDSGEVPFPWLAAARIGMSEGSGALAAWSWLCLAATDWS